MFENAGRKIQIFAHVLFYIEVIVSIIAALIIAFNAILTEVFVFILLSIGVLILGPISAWLVSLFISAFGQLVENSQIAAENNEISTFENCRKSAISRPNLSLVSSEELIRRVSSKEWPDSYKNYCIDELNRRNVSTYGL